MGLQVLTQQQQALASRLKNSMQSSLMGIFQGILNPYSPARIFADFVGVHHELHKTFNVILKEKLALLLVGEAHLFDGSVRSLLFGMIRLQQQARTQIGHLDKAGFVLIGDQCTHQLEKGVLQLVGNQATLFRL
jgi:hypothetical protein